MQKIDAFFDYLGLDFSVSKRRIMNVNKLNLYYFSATGTTARVVTRMGEAVGSAEKEVCDLLKTDPGERFIPNDELLICGMPVYSGRMPALARERMMRVKGDRTPALITCVYGNRDFDDALIELKDLLERNGFRVIKASAFIGEHSIFNAVGRGRPDASDLELAASFAREGAELAFDPEYKQIAQIRGNFPYRPVKSIPLTPKTSRKCHKCGKCVRECPVGAIDAADPRQTDKEKCIRCAHCISVCPRGAKRFGGLLYWLASRSFIKKYQTRQEPYLV